MEPCPSPAAEVELSIDRWIEPLLSQLGIYNGYRTLWFDRRNARVIHTEPDEELEHQGFVYLSTVMRPSVEELAAILMRVRTIYKVADPCMAKPPEWSPMMAAGLVAM